MANFFNELKRRNVIKAAVAYGVVAWVLVQILSIVLPSTDAPEWVMKTIMLLMIIGFPVWVLISWVYEVTPEGLKKTESNSKINSIRSRTNNRLNRVIIGSLVLAVVFLIVDKFSNSTNALLVEDEIIKSKDYKEKSIAVLAFEDMSPEKNQEYFSDGMSTELTSLLGRIKALTVKDRRSSFTYKEKNATVEQIGKELNVTHILDGSVRKYGDKVRIDVQLIDVSDGSNIWLETFDYNMEDIFKIQDSIAKAVIKQLKIVLKTDERSLAERIPTTSLEAYRLYLQGKYYINLSGFDNIDKAISLLEQSILLDPNFALAYAVLAETYMLNTIDREQNLKWDEKAYVAFQQALSLDPNLAEAYVARGMWYWTPSNNFQHENAIQDFEMAILLNPGLSSAYELLCLVQLHVGLLDKAMENGNKAIELEPTSMMIRHFIGQVYYFQGDYPNALKMYESVSEQFIPFFRIALTAQTLFYQGEVEGAIEMVKQGLLEFPNEPQLNSTYAIFLASLEKYDEAKLRMDLAIKNKTMLRHVHHLYHNLASASALMGQNKDALKWLIKASDNGLPCYPLFNQDSNLSNLKEDPNFENFMMDLKIKLEYFKDL